jgi:hypothetical protein
MWTDRHEANSRFLQFCEQARKDLRLFEVVKTLLMIYLQMTDVRKGRHHVKQQ